MKSTDEAAIDNSSIAMLTRQGQTYSTNMEFGLISNNVNQSIRDKQAQALDVTKKVADYLCSDHVPVDEHGRRLINCTEAKKWFYDNVIFIFSTGYIFDDDDTKHMDAVLECFKDMPNRAYLNNAYHLLSYEDELIQALENTVKIQNGNYHILMAVLNAADDEAIKVAPSIKFKHSGIAVISTKWNEIETIIAEYISDFGFIYEYHDKTDVHSFSQQQRLTRENYFNTNPSQNVLDLMQTEVKQNEETISFNPRANMRVGRAFGQHQRADRKDEESDFRMRDGNDLYSRIANDHLQSVTSRTKGGVLKMNLYQMQPEAKQAEFVIYPDADAYSLANGDNVAARADPMAKAAMPKITSPNYRAQRKRRVPIASPQFPK